MASLTETAYQVRRGINWIILFMILYMILQFFWGGIVIVYKTVFPPRAPTPNHAFGILPKLVFPSVDNAKQLTYTLETINGGLPVASPSAAVYFMPKKPANLLALTQTQSFTQGLQLNPKPIQETKSIYRFDDDEFLARRLRYDIVSDNFILRYAFEQDLGVFTEHQVPTPDLALTLTNGLLSDNGLLKEDIQGGRTNISFLKLVGGALSETSSLSQADAIRVDYFRKGIGNTKIVTPNPNEGPISFVFSGSVNQKKKLLQFAYTYWPIDLQHSGTYELITSEQAWQQLQDGRGYIARYPKNSLKVTIRTIILAHYDTYDPQTYLQPVFVFEGDDGFIAYVPAITAVWTE